MNLPPFLIGAGLLFWGWQTGLFLAGAPAAFLLEGARLIRWRWDLSRVDFNRVMDLSTYLFVGVAGYLALTTDAAGASRAVLTLFQWYPLTVLPLVAAQVYSTSGKIDISTLSFLSRRKANKHGAGPPRPIDLSYPFFAVCLLSASTASIRTPWFYVGLCLLSGWALWPVRSKSFSPLLWAGLFAAVVTLGYLTHAGLHSLQKELETKITTWFVGLSGNRIDPFQTHTAIGSIGVLKQSDRIVLRLEPGDEARTSLLLRQAGYDQFFSSMWFAWDAKFHSVPPQEDGLTWKLQPGPEMNQGVTISAYLDGGEGLLPLPSGARQIEQLPVGSVRRNRLGAVQALEGPGLVTYGVRWGQDGSHDGPPTKQDLTIPQHEAPILSRLVKEMGLRSQPPEETIRILADFFQNNFHYSTYLEGDPGGNSVGQAPISRFLQQTRAGHCEYFGTATVLLLRAAGIPARYATGYSVQEFSSLENRYVVRARHAHSWALVYLNGVWQDFDTTPASWVDIEQQHSSWGTSLYDLWAWMSFQYSQWKWGNREGEPTDLLGWLTIPLLVILIWRIFAVTRVVRVRAVDQPTMVHPANPGSDSEYYEIEKRLEKVGMGRHVWEPPTRWLQRIRKDYPNTLPDRIARDIIRLHYRYRFDPKGISAAERGTLHSLARAFHAGLGGPP